MWNEGSEEILAPYHKDNIIIPYGVEENMSRSNQYVRC